MKIIVVSKNEVFEIPPKYNVLPLCFGGCPIRKKNTGLGCIPEKFIIKNLLEGLI